MRDLGFSNHEKGAPRQENRNRLFHCPPEACGERSAEFFREVGGTFKFIVCHGKYFEKETVTAPPQSSDLE
jgi:hypothetical protein